MTLKTIVRGLNFQINGHFAFGIWCVCVCVCCFYLASLQQTPLCTLIIIIRMNCTIHYEV